MKLNPFLLAAACLLGAGPAAADVTGIARVLSGDALGIGDQRFRLFGIDAVELHQFCYVDGKPWTCGAAAIRSLETLVAPDRVTCKETGGADPDFGQWATCTVGGLDVADELVRAGMAVANRAQSNQYAASEDAAKAAATGIWRANFLNPWDYRAGLVAIEDQATERLRAALPAEIEKNLTEGNGGVTVFRGFEITRSDAPAPAREAQVPTLPEGFILASVSGDVFDWNEAAGAMGRWRQMVIDGALRGTNNMVWLDLQTRPRRTVETPDPDTYFTAIAEAAKAVSDAGRRPIVLVRGAGDPPWVGERIAEPPAGVTVTKRSDETSPLYIATIDGVDFYQGLGQPEQQSLVVPDDLLARLTYSTAGGSIVSLTDLPAEGEYPARVDIHYGLAIDWKPDELVELRYPYKPPEPYGGD